MTLNNVSFTLSTFVCPTEIISFSDRAEEFRSIGCELVAVSTDSEFSHLAWYYIINMNSIKQFLLFY